MDRFSRMEPAVKRRVYPAEGVIDGSRQALERHGEDPDWQSGSPPWRLDRAPIAFCNPCHSQTSHARDEPRFRKARGRRGFDTRNLTFRLELQGDPVRRD